MDIWKWHTITTNISIYSPKYLVMSEFKELGLSGHCHIRFSANRLFLASKLENVLRPHLYVLLKEDNK